MGSSAGLIWRSIRRDEGILRRVRGTPLPSWIYLFGVIGSSVCMALLGMVAVVTLGVVAFGVTIELAKLPAMIAAFVVGAATFATWGVAISGLAKSASAAPAVANAVILPMAFVSNVFVSPDFATPQWVLIVGDIFPLRHFVIAFGEAMNPYRVAPGFELERLAVLVLWMLLGAVVAWRKFRWEPAVDGSTTRSRRSRHETK